MAVQLIIKTPNQRINDLQIECDMTWTVEKIKNHLSEVYPTKPKKEEQKLIYCGRLLHDHLLLKDILHQVQGVHTMHLVCPSAFFDENETKSSKEIITEDNNSTENFSSRLPASSSLSTLNSDGLRQRLFDDSQQQTSEQNIPSSFPQFQFPLVSTTMPDVPVSTPAVAYQIAAMQQMYAQFMAQYLTQAQTGIQSFQYGSFQTPYMTAIPPTQTPPAAVNNNNQEQHINPNPAVNVREQRPQNDEDEVLGRDLLDWIYITSRVMVLFTVLYFYSSFGRILLVTILGLLLFVYRTGLFGRRHQRNSSVPRPADDVGGQRENARGENSGVGNDSHENTSDINTSQNEVQPEGTDQQQQSPSDELQQQRDPHVFEEDSVMQSPLMVAWTFFSSFFTSLIPEQPVPVNVN